jgi:hypothetical protein
MLCIAHPVPAAIDGVPDVLVEDVLARRRTSSTCAAKSNSSAMSFMGSGRLMGGFRPVVVVARAGTRAEVTGVLHHLERVCRPEVEREDEDVTGLRRRMSNCAFDVTTSSGAFAT